MRADDCISSIIARLRSYLSPKGDTRFVAALGLLVLLVLYARIEIQHFTPAYQEVDPDGYLFLAKRMARLQPLAVRDDDPFMYQTHQWVETPDGRVIPKFSPGYPLLMAPLYWLGGDEAMFWLSPLMGGLTLIGMYLLCRLWMSSLAAMLATWVLAFNPMFLIYFGYLLTHATNTGFVTWGMYFLWKWSRRGGIGNTVGAGLCLGYAVAVRHTSLLLGSVVLIAILSRCWDAFRDSAKVAPFWRSRAFRETVLLSATYALFPLGTAIYNWILFGNPFTSGYALTHEQDAFSLAYLTRNFRTMFNGLTITAHLLVLPVGLLGMLLVGQMRERAMRLLWFLPIVLLYTAYYWAPAGMPYIRFTIVTFPVIIGSAFLLLDTVAHATPPARPIQIWANRAAMILFALLVIALRYGEAQQGLSRVVSDPGSRATAATAGMLADTLEPDAVIFSQRPFFCTIGTRQHFRMYDLQAFISMPGSGERRQPKRTERLKQVYASLGKAGLVQKKRELVRRFLAQSRQVVFLIPAKSRDEQAEQLRDGVELRLLREWQPPGIEGGWGVYAVAAR